MRCYLLVQNDAASCTFLNDRERQVAIARTIKQTGTADRGGHTIVWREVYTSFIDPKNLIPMLMYFSINVSFASLPVYMPTIITGMGYSPVNAQGLSAPPYIITAIIVLSSAYASDKLQQRGFFIAGIASVGAIGFLILALCTSNG